MRVYACLLVVAICVALSSTTCDQNIIQKIKNKRRKTDDLTLFYSLSGEYVSAYFQAGTLFNYLLRSSCIKVTYKKEQELFVIIEGYSNRKAKFKVQYNEGALEFIGRNDEVFWRNYIVADFPSGYATYSCTDRNTLSGSFSAVNVRRVCGRMCERQVEAAKTALENVGLPEHNRLSCTVEDSAKPERHRQRKTRPIIRVEETKRLPVVLLEFLKILKLENLTKLVKLDLVKLNLLKSFGK